MPIFFPPHPMPPVKPNVQGVTQIKINGAYHELDILVGRLLGYGESTPAVLRAVRVSMANFNKLS